MMQFVWSMEEDLVKGLFKYVLTGSGDMFVEVIGIHLMQKWYVPNWDTLQHVSY